MNKPLNTNSALSRQLQTLAQQINSLQETTAQLCVQFSHLTAQLQTQDASCGLEFTAYNFLNSSAPKEYSAQQELFFHKDVLPDSDESFPWWELAKEHPLSCDQQVHRLTAQLTAAYHRIACLEEQLLAQRHS